MPLKKIIRIPVVPVGDDVNVTKYLSNLIDTPEFQRLRGIKQLDLIEKVYPGATHTRFEHSIGTLYAMRGIIKNIEEENEEKEAPAYKFSRTEKITLELAALGHDLFHLPFSHALEPMFISLGEPSHDEKVLEYLEEKFKPKIDKISGADFGLLVDTFKRKTPYSPMIWSLIGADVFDYTIRDANKCAIAGGSDVERLKTYAYFDGKHYGVEAKATTSLDQHVNFWIFMYMEVYNRKGCTLWKGVIRTGVYEAIKMGKIKPKTVWGMTDDELLARLTSCGGLPRKIYRRIRNREKSDTFLTLKIKEQEAREQIMKKPILVHGLPQNELMKIVSHFKDIDNAMEFERSVERELDFKKGDITVAEMPHIEMVKPEDVPLFDVSRGWTSLFKQEPDLVDHYNKQVERGYALRIGVRTDLRKRAFNNAPKVLDSLMSFI